MATRKSQRIAKRSSPAEHDDDEWRDWASLQQDMVAHIADLVLDEDGLAGYIRFRATCKPWKDATPNPAALGPGEIDHRFHPHRWMMIWSPPPIAGRDTLRRRFLNIDTRKVVEVDLPQLVDQEVLVGSARAPEGLLVMRDRNTFVVRLLNPLTRHVVDLPSLSTLYPPGPGCSEGHIPSKLWYDNTTLLTAAGFTDRSTVVIYLRRMNKMAVAKPGDACWTLVKLHSWIPSTFTFQDRFYCIENNTLKTVVVGTTKALPRLEAVAELDKELLNINMVDNGGKLMLVCSTNYPRYQLGSQTMIVLYEVSLEEGSQGTVRRVRDLAGGAVFAGELGTVLLPSTRYYPSVVSDAVYFRFGMFQRYLGIQFMDNSYIGRILRAPLEGNEPNLARLILMCVTCIRRDVL